MVFREVFPHFMNYQTALQLNKYATTGWKDFKRDISRTLIHILALAFFLVTF